MKSILSKTIVVAGLIAISGAAYGNQCNCHTKRHESAMTKMENGTATVAKGTWHESKLIANTAVRSPVIAYEVVRGERPLFPNETAWRNNNRRESIALTGHHNEPPPI